MPKAHFIAHVRGEPRRLIHVREIKGGNGLQIVVHIKGLSDPLRPTDPRVTECRYSIHPSTRSATKAITAHSTMTFSNGDRQDVYLLTQAINNRMYQPLEIRQFPDQEDAPLFQSGGTVLDLGSYDPSTHTLQTALWFGRSDMPEPVAQNCTIRTARFARYGVSVLACFVPKPTPRDVLYDHYGTTSALRMTREDAKGGATPGESGGLPPELAEYVAVRDFNSLVLNDRTIRQNLVPLYLKDHVPEPLFAAQPEP